MAEIQEEVPTENAGPSAVAEVANVISEVVENVLEEEGDGIEDTITTRPEAQRAPARRRFKGLRLSLILNAVTLGLGSWALMRGWENHVAKPSIQFLSGLAVGAWTGLNLVRRYKRTKRLKARKARMINFSYGHRELKVLMGGTPYWIDFTRMERLSVLNMMIRKTWRFYESAICKQIIASVEPILMQYKPIFVSAIRFKKLTFGDAPFKATHISVIKEDVDEIVFEIGIRWDGAACVAIGIEIIGTGLITPSVKRLDFFALARISLTRMKPRMPGFGAMLISFQAPPFVTFDLDCGPGIGELIEAWLIPFLKNDLLGNMLVWPNRLVIPLMPLSELGPLDNLRLRTRGVLRVVVVEAKGLPKSDLIGKGDPFAVLETVALKPSKTKVIPNTDRPQWNETLYLKVQEIEQSLRVTVRDQESAVVGALTMQTSQVIGRAVVPLKDLNEAETDDSWYPLGSGDWGDLNGPGDGAGQIHLQLCYYSLESLRSGQAVGNAKDSIPRGFVFVTISEGSNLHSIESNGLSDPYCIIWLGGVKKTTRTLKNTLYPVWNESVDWSNVSAFDALFVEVHDKGTISDRLLGKAKQPLLPIAKECTESETHQPLECILNLEGDRGEVSLLVEWIPLDNNEIIIRHRQPRTHADILSNTVKGMLFVRLVSAEGLKNVDVIGLSDPFAVLKIGGNLKISKYINNNINPVWNQTFSWQGVRDTTMLHGEIKDKGTLRDMSLGTFKIRIASLVDTPGEIRPFTIGLMDKKTGERSQGSVNLQLSWVEWNREQNEEVPQEPEWPEFNELLA